MNKVSLKHRKETWNDKNDNHMSESALRHWIQESINEGLSNYSFSEIIAKMFDTDKIRTMLIESLTPTIMNGVSPYYNEEFYCSISADRIVISPWWDNHWQDIRIIDFIQESIDKSNTESKIKLKNALIKSIEIIEKALNEED
jgi:hypothetical protein